MNKEAVSVAIKMLDLARVKVSGHRVGAAVVAYNSKNEEKVFGGCNIELACATGFHAERVALLKSISEGYNDIREVYVTSSGYGRWKVAAMCGYCRQDFMYINPNCVVIVIDKESGEPLIQIRVIDTLLYPYLSKGTREQFIEGKSG